MMSKVPCARGRWRLSWEDLTRRYPPGKGKAPSQTHLVAGKGPRVVPNATSSSEPTNAGLLSASCSRHIQVSRQPREGPVQTWSMVRNAVERRERSSELGARGARFGQALHTRFSAELL